MNTRNQTSTRSAVVLGGLAFAAFLAACGGDRGTTRRASGPTVSQRGEAVPVASSIGSPVVDPSVVGTPSGTAAPDVLPAGVPAAPPTLQDVKQAWKEGVSMFDTRDYEGSVPRLQIVAEARPADAYARYLLGLALWKTGHLEEAETALAASGGLDGDKPKTWINLARVRLQRGNAAGALEAADQALTLDPGSADVLHQRGRALAMAGRNDEAIETLQQARAAAPENGYIANTLGHFLLTRGRVDESVGHLEAARDLLPEVAFVRNNLGVAYERQGDLDRAVEEYRAAVGAGDSEGKSAASLARLEPIVGHEKIAGETTSEPATVEGAPAGDSSS